MKHYPPSSSSLSPQVPASDARHTEIVSEFHSRLQEYLPAEAEGVGRRRGEDGYGIGKIGRGVSKCRDSETGLSANGKRFSRSVTESTAGREGNKEQELATNKSNLVLYIYT